MTNYRMGRVVALGLSFLSGTFAQVGIAQQSHSDAPQLEEIIYRGTNVDHSAVGLDRADAAIETVEGHLHQPAGRVVGGFDASTGKRLRKALDAFPSAPSPTDPRWADERIRWVEPRIVIAIRYSEWDRSGQVRFPIFSGLRPEVSPQECVRAAMVEPRQATGPRLVDIQLPRLPI